MRKIIAFSLLTLLLAGCKHFHIGDVLDGPGMVNEDPRPISLSDLQQRWEDRLIVVHSDSNPDIKQLLKAFNEIWETKVVDSLLAKINEPDFEGSYSPDDGTSDIILTYYARPYPFVQYFSEKDGAECLDACTIRRNNGHTLLLLNLRQCHKKDGNSTYDGFYLFYDYDPKTTYLKPEKEPWANVKPVVEGNELRPLFDLFEGIFAVGEYEKGATEPDYHHVFDFNGQDFVYTGYESNLPDTSGEE